MENSIGLKRVKFITFICRISENWIRESKVWCPSMKLIVYYGSQEDRRATRQYIMANDAGEFNVMLTT